MNDAQLREWWPERQRLNSIHEAAHSVIAEALGVRSDGAYLAFPIELPPPHFPVLGGAAPHAPTTPEFRATIAFAGYVAEGIVGGRTPTADEINAGGDLKIANDAWREVGLIRGWDIERLREAIALVRKYALEIRLLAGLLMVNSSYSGDDVRRAMGKS